MQEQKMNICLLNDSFPPTIDGVSNTVFNYASVIHGSLGNVVVGTPQYPGARDECPFPVVRYPSLRIKKITDYRTGVPFDPVSVRAILGYEPDIIHTHCPFASALLARTLRRLGGAPIVFTYHTKFDIDIANIFGTELMRAAAAKFLVSNVEECDEVWVVSRGAGENLKSLGYAGGVTVMKNGVDFPKGRVPRRAIDAVSEKHALPDGVPVFLFVGRMMWYKGIRMILDGLVRVKKRGADFRMVFVGSGGEFDEIQACAETLGLADRCVFVGAVNDREALRAYFCRADLFLFPSSYDTNGIVVHEAAACGLASALLRGSAAAEDVTDGVNGLLIDENADSLAETLLRVTADLPFARALGERAAGTLYIPWEDAVKKACERYRVIVERHKGSPRKPTRILSGRQPRAADLK